MPVCTKVRKPDRDASRRYGPSGRFVRTYAPVSSVTLLRTTPVCVWVAVTVTPGSTPRDWSATLPLTCAVACALAMAGAAQQAANQTRRVDTRAYLQDIKALLVRNGGPYLGRCRRPVRAWSGCNPRQLRVGALLDDR